MVCLHYVAIEGIDGSGKSTVCALLAESLLKRNFTPVRLVEPSYGRTGKIARQMAANGEPDALIHSLFSQDRREQAEARTRPLLEFIQTHPASSFVIIQDRSLYSAPAYQRADMPIKLTIDEQAAIAPIPERVILLDVLPDVAQYRQAQRNRLTGTDVVESAKLEKARRQYLAMAQVYNFMIVDAAQPADVIVSKIMSNLWPEDFT